MFTVQCSGLANQDSFEIDGGLDGDQLHPIGSRPRFPSQAYTMVARLLCKGWRACPASSDTMAHAMRCRNGLTTSTLLDTRQRAWLPTLNRACRGAWATGTCRSFATNGDVDQPGDHAIDHARPAEPGGCNHLMDFDPSSENDGSTADAPKAGVWAQKDKEFWERAMQAVNRTSARQMIPRLKQDDPLGVDTSLRGASNGKGTVYDFALGVRLQHKHKVLLIRVGDFYEAFGFDAVILVQYAGLNPMGSSGVPRAGCPNQNIGQTLRELTNAGFTTVVCEEVPEPPSFTRRARRKQRFVAGIVSQASPEYVYHRSFMKTKSSKNALEDAEPPQLFGFNGGSCSTDSSSDSVPEVPVVGISATSRGISIACVDVDLHQVRLMEGLTEEAATTRILAGGFAPPLYIHESLFQRAMMPQALHNRATSRGRIMGPLAEACRTIAHVSKFSGSVPHRELVRLTCQNLDIEDDAKFRVIRANVFQGAPSALGEIGETAPVTPSSKRQHTIGLGGSETVHAPMPLTLHSAQQLGVLSLPGIPPLLESLLPNTAPAACYHWMREKLMHPPSPKVAGAIRGACKQLITSRQPLPIFESSTRAGRAVKLMTSYQADYWLFHDILKTTLEVGDFLLNLHFAELASDILVLVAAETGIEFSRERLSHECNEAGKAITDVIEATTSVISESDFVSVDQSIDIVQPLSADSGNLTDILEMDFLPALRSFFNQVEANCWGKVKDEHMQMQVTRVQETREQFLRASLQGFYPTVERLRKESNVKQSIVSHDIQNKAVWLKVPKKKTTLFGEENQHFVKPTDRNGQKVSDKFTTVEIEDARQQYFHAIHDLHQETEKVLWSLSHKIAHRHLPCVITSCFFATIAKSLTFHVSHCLSKDWVMSQLDSSSNKLNIVGMWPYWMNKSSPSTVCNDVTLRGMMLLTGPNMAGKSTVIRTLGVVCLLANCGFLTPVQRAEIPQFSSFSVRMMCADSPLEGQSAFAVEMLDLNSILRTANTSSLVLVDEVGRGTEPGMGTALSGSVLESLDRSGCMGIFATHLHGILDLPLQTKRTEKMAMQTKQNNGRNVATWKLVDGVNSVSLAIETALDCGIPVDVASRAEHLFLYSSKGGEPYSARAEQISNRQGQTKILKDECWQSEFISILEEKIIKILTNHKKDPPHSLLVLQVAQNELVPPLINSTRSCVYVLQTGAKKVLYVGETDSVNQRIKAHRKKHMDALFYVVPVPGGKSLARLIETELIRSFKSDGCSVIACKDALNVSFGAKT